MWTQGLHYCLLISVSSCLTVDHFPRTPVQDESLTLICSLTITPEEHVSWHVIGSYRYSFDCELDWEDIIKNEDDPTNYNVTCDIQPNITYQYNLTINRLQKQQHETTWECNHLYNTEQLNVTVLVRAEQPVWTPGAADYREGQLYNLTCSTNVADPVPSFSWWIVGPNNITNELAGTSYGWQNETGIHNTIAFLPNRTLGVVDIWCRLNQSQFGELDSHHHTVNVIYAPKQAVTDASDVLGYVDGTVTLNCSVPDEDLGNPEGHWFEWTRAYGDIVDDNNGADGHLALDLTSVDFDDVYTCFPNNTAGRGEPANINLTVLATPKLDSELESMTDVHYNATLSLSCKCTSRPKSAVSWSGYNDIIFQQTAQNDSEQGDRIKITQSEVLLEWHTDDVEERKHGSGRVTCRCVNSAGEIETYTEIDVQYPPTQASVCSSHEGLIVVDEQTKPVIVSCQVSEENRGNPPIYNYTWTLLRDGDIPGDDPTAQNLTLDINRNNLCLDNEYTCTAANIFGEAASDAVNVTLAVAPELEQPIDTHYDILYDNDSFALSCRYNAKPEASVLWKDLNDAVFEAIDLANQPNGDCNLMVYSSQRLQWRNNTSLEQRKAGSGFVTCAADNGVGAEHTENVTINVQYGPGVPALTFIDDVVYANGSANMTCSFTPGLDGTDGNPTVTEYTWLFGNDTLVDSSSHVTFAVTSVTQEGEYACYGTNHPVGGHIRGNASQPEYLTVNVSPYLVQPAEPSDTVVVLYNDQNTSLSCLGAGKPEVDFNWYHNGNQVDEEDFFAEKDVEAGEYLYDLQYGWRSYLMRALGGFYFTCDNITKYDGYYQCKAYNDERVSNMSAPVRLITHYPAHWAGPVLHPKLYTSPGDNFTLICGVCMEPRGNITWYMNGEPVRDNVSITDDGRNLTLTDVQLEDFGNYTCQVINIILNENYIESFDISLVERGAPHRPLAFHVDDSTSRSLNVSWLPGSTGGYDSQTFTLCYEMHHINQTCERINDPGGSDAISKSLGDLKANTTYQLQLHAENAHHGDNRSSLTTMNNSTKVAPVIKIVDFDLSATRVTVTWVVEAGEPSHLTLVHCPAEDCDVTTQRSRRYVKATWRELATNIPPDEESYTYEAEEDEQFDVYSHNRFNLWAYEPGLNDRSNTDDDDDAIWDVHPLSPGVDIGLVVGVVLAVVAAAALATSGFVYYRKKSTKGPSHREIGQGSLGMSPEGVRNPGYDDSDDIEPYGEVSFNDPPLSEPAASSKDLPSDVVKYAQVVKPKKKAKAAADASAVYAIVDKTEKKTKTPDPVPEDETQDPYENVDFPKNKIEYLDKEPYYLSKDGLIYVNLFKKGPEVIHETAYEPSDYKTIDWVRTAQINKHPRPPTPPDTPPPRAEKYDDEEDIFGPLPFQAKEEEEQDGDFDEENVDYEDDGTRPIQAPITASMTQHSRREQVPEGAVGGVEDHEMDSGHSSPRGPFFSST